MLAADHHGGGQDEVYRQCFVSEAQVRPRLHSEDEATLHTAIPGHDNQRQIRDVSVVQEQCRQGRTPGE